MRDARRKFVLGIALLLAGGAIIGWLYGRPFIGLATAAIVALAWQVRQLLVFERALRTGDFEELRYSRGIWAQIYAEYNYQRYRGQKYRRRYKRLLKEVRNSTKALPDGAVLLNADFEILTCNPASDELAGFRGRQDRGQRVDNIVRDPAFTEYLRSRQFDRAVEIRSPLYDGQWLNLRIVPYGADQYLLLIRDITERIRLSKMRREFVANASHELRSPLTVISGYVDALSTDPETPETWKKPVVAMQEQAERMKTIISELLELSRLESATTDPGRERIDVCALLTSARKIYADRQDVAKIEIECVSPAILLGRASEIESVIANLLSNAVRHTPPSGRITLSWRAGPEGGLLAVEDTGEGIDPELIPRLTERFFRVNRGRSRADGGIGLGLAIVKHALGRHGAELEIESQVGKGSSFTCRFPVDRLVGAELVPLRAAGAQDADKA
ncbi:MAG: phosphate regulon sensor histidine kinase PhoR [Gammaproteobacteria bacterium]|nr:phosphate regulon sensor histidine kinase PhoR [Gammaproteobacteria bacterium]MDH4252957.1 phosphate regulon sensor histidine kinase PhoR [Gammaproteobacteria bacterium]MDH5308357.1 phosphate regulon sensor histidine kinase PhoR [Gammaproteobacteria bacterium]